MAETFKRLQSGSSELNRIQSYLRSSLENLFSKEILGGQLVEDLVVAGSSADNKISHGLSREPLGYFVVRSDAQVTLWDSPTTNPTPSQTILLRASASATISLWVF